MPLSGGRVIIASGFAAAFKFGFSSGLTGFHLVNGCSVFIDPLPRAGVLCVFVFSAGVTHAGAVASQNATPIAEK
jgi:hypothetical protein